MNGPSREQAQSNPEPPVPYRSTPIFDEIRLPDALRNVHSLKGQNLHSRRATQADLLRPTLCSHAIT